MFTPYEKTTAEIQSALLSGEITCRGLVEYYLRRIAAYDQQDCALNAIICLNPRALEIADRCDAMIREQGISSPLFGIPVLIKDNIETAEMPTTAGSESLRGWTPKQNSILVEKLENAGAIILGKTNLHEFAIWGETISSILGQTRNPYDLSRTPGGSSGGTGAAIAANFAVLGIGTDTINSVRSPASACSLVGIRPTMGLVSRSGIVPYSLTQDTAGPICRTVEDAAKLLDVLAGYDRNDIETSWSMMDQHDVFADHLNPDGLRGKRIGVLRSFLGTEDIHQSTNAVMERAVMELFLGGAELLSLDDPIDSAWLTQDVSLHLYDLKTHLSAYLARQENVPVHSMEEILRSGKYHPGIHDNLMEAKKHDVGTDDYNRRLVLREQVRTQLMRIFAAYRLDTIVYPHQQQCVCKIGQIQQQRNGVLCSVTGFPSVCVPAGFTPPEETAPLGIPVGMEIIGRPWSESTLIEIAYGYEQRTHHRLPPACTTKEV